MNSKAFKPAFEFILEKLGKLRREELGVAHNSNEAPAIEAWHGSPHDFGEFGMEHIGKGEGAQAYGHGLYFTDRKGIAEFYRDKLSDPDIVYKNTSIFDSNGSAENSAALQIGTYMIDGMKFEKAKKLAIDDLKNSGMLDDPYIAEQFQYLQAIKPNDIQLKGSGKLYKVGLMPKEDEFLYWDKPLSEQPEKIKNILTEALPDIIEYKPWRDGPASFRDELAANIFAQQRGLKDYKVVPDNLKGTRIMVPEDPTGREIYKELMDRKAPPEKADPPGYPRGWGFVHRGDEGGPAASKYLNSIGIRGIRYLDNTSRAARSAADIEKEIRKLNNIISDTLQLGNKFGLSEGVKKNLDKYRKNIAMLEEELKSGPKPTYNYVLFNDKDVVLKNKYLVPLATGGTGIAAMGLGGGQAEASEAPKKKQLVTPVMGAKKHKFMITPVGFSKPLIQRDSSGSAQADFFSHLKRVESNNDPSAVSPKGAGGLFQVMPETAADPGFGVKPLANRFDPVESERFARDYFAAMLREMNGDKRAALAAWNWGVGNAQNWVKNGANWDDLPEETQGFINKLEAHV